MQSPNSIEDCTADVAQEIIRTRDMGSFTVVVCDGNIGAGKTTFLELLSSKLNRNGVSTHFIYEDIRKADDLFVKYTREPEVYSYRFQKWILMDKLEQMRTAAMLAKPGDVVVVDRHLLADYRVFCKNLYASGKLRKRGWTRYKNIFEQQVERDSTLLRFLIPEWTIYIDVDAAVCLDRIKSRGREGEEHYSDQYIAGIDAMYRRLYSAMSIEFEKRATPYNDLGAQCAKKRIDYPCADRRHRLLYIDGSLPLCKQ